jgi:hypothetical protein
MFANMPLNLWHLFSPPQGMVDGNPAERPSGLTMGSAAATDEPRLNFPAQVFTHMAATPLGIPGDIEAFSRLALGASRENTIPSGSAVTDTIARALMGLMEQQQRAQMRQPMPMTQNTSKRASGW